MLELVKGLFLWNDTCKISKAQGSHRKPFWNSDEDLVKTVYQKSETLNQASESLPWTFASQANWTKRYTIWHTKTSTATRTTRKVMDRQERRNWSFSIPGMVYVLFWFIGILLLFFLLLFVCLLTLFSSISWGRKCSRDEGGSGDQEANRIVVHDVKPQSFIINVFKKDYLGPYWLLQDSVEHLLHQPLGFVHLLEHVTEHYYEPQTLTWFQGSHVL